MQHLILHVKIFGQPAASVTGILTERYREYNKIHLRSRLKKQIIQLTLDTFYQRIGHPTAEYPENQDSRVVSLTVKNRPVNVL